MHFSYLIYEKYIHFLRNMIMNEEVNKIIDNLNPNIRKLIEDFNLEIVEPESVECVCLKGFEKNDNRMVIWNFDNDTTTTELCDFIIQRPEIDTLYLGKAITDNEDGEQIQKLHYLLSASHNIIPVIQDIELEDDSRYCVVDGMLIDKKYSLVVDYASGRKEESIHVPDGIIGLKEHCFNYNEYVERIEIPTSLKCFDGLESLSYLKKTVMYGKHDSIYSTEDNVLYKMAGNNDKRIYFIPPYHEKYVPQILIKSSLNNLFQSICKEADNGRWNNISSENFYYDEEYNKISIEYYGGFYGQEWFIEYKPLPTEIRLGYIFRDHWREFCASEISCKQDCNENIIRLDCNNCPNWGNCKKVYDSNTAYINKLFSMMCDVVGNDSLMIGGNYLYLPLGWNDCQAICGIVLKFLDKALSLREKHPISATPLQPSLFPEISAEEEDESDNFPFNFRLYDSPLGYTKYCFVDDEEPPF